MAGARCGTDDPRRIEIQNKLFRTNVVVSGAALIHLGVIGQQSLPLSLIAQLRLFGIRLGAGCVRRGGVSQ
jgi:hypothetical protein